MMKISDLLLTQNQAATTAAASTSSTLRFTIEQWELTRRLRNSGLTKEQLCQAFDDIERMELELGSLYNTRVTATTTSSEATCSSPSDNNASDIQQMLMAKQHKSAINGNSSKSSIDNNGETSVSIQAIVNEKLAESFDVDEEAKELDELRLKGELSLHNEIAAFVSKHDLKQSQIARMAGVNQSYVSKFLRGEFYELSENGKTNIFKWYLRFTKNPSIFLKAYDIQLNSSLASLIKSIGTSDKVPTIKSEKKTSFANMTNSLLMHYEAPKRTRFSFKPEHLVILEKSFIENQYPDQKRREELARFCNEARACTDREKVNEQIITHWFQNKRKITKKANEDPSSINSQRRKSLNECEEDGSADMNEDEDQISDYRAFMNQSASSSPSKSFADEEDLNAF